MRAQRTAPTTTTSTSTGRFGHDLRRYLGLDGRVKAQHKLFQRARRRYVATDFVLSELIAHLYTTLTPDQAQRFVNNLLASADSGSYRLVHVAPQQFRRAWELRQKYHDKPDISFVDFTSMVVMQELGITEVFTGDAHFQQVNLNFRLVP